MTIYGEQQYHSNSQCMHEAFAARDSVGPVIRKCASGSLKSSIQVDTIEIRVATSSDVATTEKTIQ